MASEDARHQRVAEGLEALDVWLEDRVREGLARLEGQPAAFERLAARLVDAQARGLARWVRSLSPTGPDWPEGILAQLGRIALVTEAFRRLYDLPPALREDVRAQVGWTWKKEDVRIGGEHVRDRWIVLGTEIDDDGDLTARRDWLAGERSGRVGLLLQFVYGYGAFEVEPTAGAVLDGELAFYPGAAPERVVVVDARVTEERAARLPGDDGIAAFLDRVAATIAAVPWRTRFGGALRDVVPVHHEGRWWLRDARGEALPVRGSDPWVLLAVSGGHPVDVAVEWDTRTLRPLGVLAGGRYEPIP